MATTKLTTKMHREIVTLLRAGLYQALVADHVGIGDRTLRGWVSRGERDGARVPYASFARDVRRAQAQHAGKLQKVINHAATVNKEWKAAAWDLERRYPHLYSLTHRFEVELRGKLEGFLDALRGELDEDTFQVVLAAADRAAAKAVSK